MRTIYVQKFPEAPLLSLFVNSGFATVDVFKTNVTEKHEAKKIISLLLSYDPYSKVNFDLEDCDKILRVESKKINPIQVIQFLNEAGFECTELI